MEPIALRLDSYETSDVRCGHTGHGRLAALQGLLALDDVDPAATVALVLALLAVDVVISTGTPDGVIAAAALRGVVAATTADVVVAGSAQDEVRAVVTGDGRRCPCHPSTSSRRLPLVPMMVSANAVPTALVNPTIESALPLVGPPPARLTVTPALYPGL